MMTKQNLNPWARWKALLFIPLAALLLQAFARPEINRELEQISTLKGTEILQENTDWTEEKFLEELRKCLPEGVSRELSYEDTWKESIKKYGFDAGKLKRDEGLVLAMNKGAAMLVENKHMTISDVPDFLAENLTTSKDGKNIKWMVIQRDGNNTPSDDYQNLLNVIGEAYMQKRNEAARQRYQTGYDALDAEQKAVVDDVVPILVLAGDRRVFPSILQGPPSPPQGTTSENAKKAATANSSKMQMQGVNTWKEAEVAVKEFDKIKNRQIICNGKKINVGDLNSELPEQFRLKKLAYNNVSVKWILDYPCIVNGKWETSANVDLNDIAGIDTYTGDEAVKRYGNKAKDGVIAIITIITKGNLIIVPDIPETK